MLFQNAAQEFLNWADGEHREHPNTARRVRGSFASLRQFFANKEADSINAGDLEQFKTYRRRAGIKEVTIRHDIHSLSKFFQYGERREWCRDNPVRRIKVPSDRDAIRQRVLEPHEEKAYFRAASESLYDLGRLMLNQGCRPQEILNLRREHVDLYRRTLYIRRGKSDAATRLLPLMEESVAILKHRIEDAPVSGWLFPSPRYPDRPITKLNTVHTKLCKRLGLRFVIYDFRHSFATRFMRKERDMTALKKLLGHKDLRTVDRYIHPTFEDLREAMAHFEKEMKAEYVFAKIPPRPVTNKRRKRTFTPDVPLCA